MSSQALYYEIPPRTIGIERLDILEEAAEWMRIRDLVQSDLRELDDSIRHALPDVRIRAGSNHGGRTLLFTYRVYEAGPETGIDPVVVGVRISRAGSGSAGDERFAVTGDIAGEALGDILFELAPREVQGFVAVIEQARDLSSTLARHADEVVAALRDGSRRE